MEKQATILNDYFDKIVCINTTDAEERRNKVKRFFDLIGLQVDFFIVDRHPNGAHQGCYTSHIKVITEAYKQNVSNILIFEDDVVGSSELREHNLKRALKFLDEHPWDLFYFGAVPDLLVEQCSKKATNIYRVRNICAHAYALNKNAIKKYSFKPYNPNHQIDFLLSNDHELITYAYYPSIFYQTSMLRYCPNYLKVKLFQIRETLGVKLHLDVVDVLFIGVLIFILTIPCFGIT